MKLALSGGAVVALAAVAGVGLLWLNRRSIGAAVGEVADQVVQAAQVVNPASPENFVYKGVGAAGAAATGDKDFSLGTWLWEKLNPAAVAREKVILGPVLPGITTADVQRMDKELYRLVPMTGNGQGLQVPR